MNPKLVVIIAILVTLLSSSAQNSNCEDAYTSASYSLSHSKKAFNAHNFDHQKYYAGRALEALEKTRDLVAECGCERAMDPIDEGIENLEEALDPTDWKMGRYYSKRAMGNMYSILENLDMCSMDGGSATDTAETENNSGSITSSSIDTKNKEAEVALSAFKEAAEEQLEQLNEKIQEIGLTLGCDNSQFVLDQSQIEIPEDQAFASLEEAMDYYKSLTIKAYEKAVAGLQECSNKE